MKFRNAAIAFISLSASQAMASGVDTQGEWEPAPFMDQAPFGLDSTHTFGFVLRGKAYAITGNKRVPEFDFCGNCVGTNDTFRKSMYEDFSDAYYSYEPETGWTDLGPFPGGERGYGMGDIMDRGSANETLYFGLGISQKRDPETGEYLEQYPRWGTFENGTYGLGGIMVNQKRLQDWWSFNGTHWKELAPFPGAGRSHPAVSAENGVVFAGLGLGELCVSMDDPCKAADYYPSGDPLGKSWNLRDVWMYTVATDTWEQVSDFPYPVHHPLHFGAGGGAYMLGGHAGAIVYNKVWRHNHLLNGTDSWTEVAPIPGAGRVAATQFDHNGYGYIMGGEIATKGNGLMEGWPNAAQFGLSTDPDMKEDHRSMPTNEFLQYDPVSDSWQQLPSCPDDGSRWAASNFVLDDYVYVFNGVIRKGHYHFGNFTQVWPQQGYRYYLGKQDTGGQDSAAYRPTLALASLVAWIVFLI